MWKCLIQECVYLHHSWQANRLRGTFSQRSTAIKFICFVPIACQFMSANYATRSLKTQSGIKWQHIGYNNTCQIYVTFRLVCVFATIRLTIYSKHLMSWLQAIDMLLLNDMHLHLTFLPAPFKCLIFCWVHTMLLHDIDQTQLQVYCFNVCSSSTLPVSTK